MVCRIKTMITVIMTLILFPLSAQEYPYQWLSLGISEDPATLQRIRWRTPVEMTEGFVEFCPATASPDFINDIRRVRAVSLEENDYGKVMIYHHAVLEGLQPGQSYLYRIGDGQMQWSEWIQFTTAHDDPSPFSFLYISDVQVGIHDHYPRVIRKAATTAGDASFIMFTGDLTGGASEWEWNAFFRSNGWLLAMMPVAAVPDSHEYTKGPGEEKSRLTTYWNHLFSYPENTPGELLDQGNYFFDYQCCRFVMINTRELESGGDDYREQVLSWLENVLSENPHPWCIVGQHRPVYSISEGRGNGKIKEYLKPLYDKYDVDLVLTGHDHIYGRIRGEQNACAAEHLQGPVYVVSVAGPQVYMPQYDPAFDRIGSNLQLFQHITVDPRQIDFKAYTATGELYDHFVISATGTNKTFSDRAKHITEITDMPTKTWQTYDESQLENFRNRKRIYEESKRRD